MGKFKKSLRALWWKVADDDSQVMVFQPDWNHTLTSLDLQTKIGDLERALAAGGDERLAELAFQIGVTLGELRRIRLSRVIDRGKKSVTSGRAGGEKKREKYGRDVKDRDEALRKDVIAILKVERDMEPRDIRDRIKDRYGANSGRRGPRSDAELTLGDDQLLRRISKIKKDA